MYYAIVFFADYKYLEIIIYSGYYIYLYFQESINTCILNYTQDIRYILFLYFLLRIIYTSLLLFFSFLLGRKEKKKRSYVLENHISEKNRRIRDTHIYSATGVFFESVSLPVPPENARLRSCRLSSILSPPISFVCRYVSSAGIVPQIASQRHLRASCSRATAAPSNLQRLLLCFFGLRLLRTDHLHRLPVLRRQQVFAQFLRPPPCPMFARKLLHTRLILPHPNNLPSSLSHYFTSLFFTASKVSRVQYKILAFLRKSGAGILPSRTHAEKVCREIPRYPAASDTLYHTPANPVMSILQNFPPTRYNNFPTLSSRHLHWILTH